MSNASNHGRNEKAPVSLDPADLYQLFFEEAPDCMMATDHDGKFILVNRKGCNLTGYSREELLCMTIRDIFTQEEGGQGYYSIDNLQPAGNVTMECTILSKDGRLIPVEIIIRPHSDGKLLIIVRDMTDRVQAEMAGQKLQQQLLSIIEFLPDATFVIDRDKKIIAWNRACELMTGVSKESMVGQGDFAYSKPFWGDRRPILIDLLDLPSSEIEASYKYVRHTGGSIYAESFIPHFNDGKGVHLWGVAAPLFDPHGHRCGAVESIRDVSEQKRIEKELREGELRYRTLFETAGDAIMLMRGERFVDCNARTLSLFGCSREEFIGSSPYKFSPPLQPDGRRSEEKAIENITGAIMGEARFFEWEHCRFDGTPFPAEVTLNRMELGGEILLQAIVRDITERKKFGKRLAESEQKYRELVEQANSIILRWNSSGQITFLNEFGQRLFGYSAGEIIGRHVIGTIVPWTESSGRDLRQLMEQICADPEAFEQNVNENVRRNGERIWISWTNRVVLDSTGQVAEILSVGTDITERRLAEEEIRRLHKDLQQYAAELESRVAERTAELAVALDHAEESDRLKSAFLATMSHELRTPLNSIIGFTGILLMGLVGPLNEEQEKQLVMVQDSARHLLELINDVLDISRIEAGQFQLACERFDMKSTIEKSLEKIIPLAEKKRLALTSVIDPSVGEIYGDRRRVEQIIINLLNNAVKFTDCGEVRIESRIEDEWIVTDVIDTGIGIRSEDMDNLFKPFRQIDTGISRQYEGTGLGLSICKKLVEAMGGNIYGESKFGSGSIFTFTMPRERR
ncbi:MAG: PAS domain S-box protein [Candidatus Eremiobacterota bacterium]